MRINQLPKLVNSIERKKNKKNEKKTTQQKNSPRNIHINDDIMTLNRQNSLSQSLTINWNTFENGWNENQWKSCVNQIRSLDLN